MKEMEAIKAENASLINTVVAMKVEQVGGAVASGSGVAVLVFL